MSDLDQLTQVIQVILSNDNQARIQGENLLLSLRQGDFNSYVITFANLLNVSTSKHIRMFCVVHLRRLLSNFVESTKSSQWHTLPNDTQKFLKTLFIEVLQKEEDGPTRRVLCDLIGELASTIKQLDNAKKNQMGEEGKQWDSLMQNIWGFLTSGNIVLMESALKILSILFLYCGKDFAQHKDDLYNILKQALEHDDLRVKASAIEAISSFMGSSFTKDCMAFKDLIPLVLTSTVSIISKNEDLGADVLNELSDILAAECRLFKPYFKEFFTMLKEITQMNLTIDTIRGNALEILVQLIEAIPSVPRNKTEFIKDFFECNYLYMVSCVEDADQQWISPPEGFVDTTDDSNSHEASVKHAMYMIDRVMSKLGSELALPIFSQVLLEVAKVENWKYKHSALMGLSQIGEYIGDAKELDYVVSFTLNFFKDEHPKVRFAALQCIGQFSEDSKPEFQMGYTEKIIPALVGMFSDSVPRVVAHALAAITNFLDGAERGSVSNYIQQVLEPCLGFINQSISFVKEAAVTAVATLAEACEHEFIPYWENTAQLLFQILKDAPDKRYKLLKGSAIECLMLIGQSVGKQEFRKGAHDIIEKLADIQKNYVEEVDPPKSYLLSAWQRICLILGEDFLPYLDHILPLLFNLVEEIVQAQNKTKANETSDMLKALGANKDNLFHKANTAESEDVVLAIKMINVFVLELSKGFGPYVERTSDLLTSLLLRSNNVDLKAISARGLPGLIKVVKETSDPNKQDIIRNLCNKYIEVLWTVIDREKDPETRLVYAMIMSKVLKVSGKVMTEAEVNALGENVFASLKKSDEAKISNQELIEDDEYGVDENEVEAIENENAEEEEYHCALAEVIGALFEWHPELALPIAHTIYTKALPNLFVENMPPKMYKFGLFLVDNLIEHIGYDYLSNEWSMLSQAVIQYVTHSKAEVRHLAAYGIGQLAAKTKGDFQSLAEACMKALLTALDIRKEKDEDAEVYSLTKDNIIAAIGKIIKHQPQAINFKEVTQGWFKMLPLKSDKKEAREQHDLLMNIILNIDPVIIFGQKGENLPQAVKIMAFAVNTKYSYPDFQDKMKKVIEALVGQPDTKSLLQDAFSKLDNNHKEKMKSLLG